MYRALDSNLARMAGEPVPSLTLLVIAPNRADPSAWWETVARDTAGRCSLIVASAGSLPLEAPVRWVSCEHGSSIFRLWAAAIEEASSTYVAVLDARCPPAPGWLDAAHRAIARGIPAFFGPVSGPASKRGLDVVQYLLEYGQFAPPIARAMDDVPGNNFVFRRDLLAAASLADRQFHKVFFVAGLREHGHAPVRRDDLEVTYAKRYRAWYYLARRFAHGRTYAALRGGSLTSRWLRGASAPALPLLRLARVARSLRGKPSLRAALLRHAPYAFAAETAWSLGECAGYLTGKMGSAAFLD